MQPNGAVTLTSDIDRPTPGEAEAEGILVPVEWNEAGRVTAVSLNTTDDRELLVELGKGRGAPLLDLVGRRVRVRGRIRTASSIVVTDFEIAEVEPRRSNDRKKEDGR